jgi:hypothetical protein
MKPEDIAALLKMSDEDKAAFLAVAGKYPLDTVVVPKSQFTDTAAKFAEADKLVKQWDTWKKDNWDADHGMTKQQWAAAEEVDTLRTKVTELEAGTYVPSGDNMNFADVEKELTAKGYLTKDTATGLLTAVKTELEGKLGASQVGNEFFFNRMLTLPQKYAKEFGAVDDFDPEAFMRFVASDINRFTKDAEGKPVKDFSVAYNEFVAGKRLQVERAKLDQEKQEVTALKTELETRKTAIPQSPTDDGRTGVPPPFQRRIQGTDQADPKLAEGAPFGSGALAAQAFALYQKGELPGVSKPN